MGPEDSVGMVRGSVIEIHAYHELWPAEFARVRDELISVLPDWAHEIHHVGSTSIPGLAAKPIIDILVGVPSLERARDELVEPIERLGFLYRSDDDLPDRHYCPRTVAGLRRHHVSMAVPTSRHFRNTLIFRDALRGTPGLAVEYETLKRRLAANVGEDRLSYLNGKTDFILSVLAAHGGVVGGDYPMRDLGRGQGATSVPGKSLLQRRIRFHMLPEHKPKTVTGDRVMTAGEGFVQELTSTLKFFNTTLSVFDEADSGFAPQEELYTVAGHVAHTADSIDWFIEGAFGEGWDMDFDALITKAKAVTSLKEANEWMARAVANAIAVVGAASDEELFSPITDTRIMNGAPRAAVVSGIVDHTAHHRGSLAVYARLLGKVPEMPYS